VGTGTAGTGTILHDTGIDYAFLTPFGQTGQTASVAMPGASPATGAFYDFVITRGTTTTACATPAGATMTPCHVEGSTSSTPFLNTGRQFFAGLNYLFDPVNGFVGYALSDSGLTTSATVTPLLALTGTVNLQNGFSTDFNTYLMANTTLSQTGTGTFSSSISGPGGLTIAGGTVNLQGTNTFTGGTTIAAGGTLRAGADAAMGAVSGGLTFTGGTLQATSAYTIARQVSLGAGGGTIDTNGNNVLVSTAIAGSGGLTKAGTGILTVSGANSYVGGTTINAGTLRLAAGASLPTTGALTVNGGTLDFNGNNVTIGSLAGAGGTLSLGASTLTVAEAGSTTFAGTLTGTGGVTKTGSGTLNLTGANTYTGPTSVSGGRLAVNGSITSNVTVGSGGNLGGVGTITGAVNMSGTLAPGNSIGTLSVVGSYTQAAGSTYQVETNAAGQADRINVTGAPGTATLNGGTVAVLPDSSGPYAMSTTYTILNATGGVSGAFANATSSLPFLQPSLSYDSNNAYLTLKPGGFAMGAQTTNQAAVGRVLDRSVAGATGDFATVIGTLATFPLAQGQAAMDAISGQNYSGFGTANIGGGLMVMNVLGQQMSQARGGSGAGTRVALAQVCDVACEGEKPGPWSLWGSALGVTGSVAGNGTTSTLTYNGGGIATGADYRVDPRFLVGVGLGFVSGNQYLSGFSGRGTTNSYQASLYASFVQSAFYLDAQAGYGYNDNQMTRQILIPGLQSRIAMGRTGANQFLGQVEAGYRIDIYERAAASLTPFARFQATTVNQAAFTESGASSLSLNVAQQITNSARTVLGAELAGTIDAGWRDKLALQFRLGWAHEYADTSRPVTASFAGAPGAAFTVFGAAPQRDAATIGLAANTNIAERTALYFRYDGEVGNGTDNHAFSAGLRMTW
jgi:autotransporter-associated beta strand protein